MTTFRVSIATSRPVLGHHSGPNLRRSLVFFVHHRSGSQQCHIPPSSSNRSWAQSLAQVVHSTRNSHWDYIPRSHQWGNNKTVFYQWIQNRKALTNGWFHVTYGKKYNSPRKIRRDGWTYNARDAAQKVDSIHKSLFRALNIMSKPRVRWGTRPNQPATVKASAHATASPFKVYARASVKLHVGTNMVNVSRNSAFEKQREFEASASSKSEPPVSLDNPQETTLPGATGNPEVASNTLEITSNSGADELAESKKKLVQVAPEDARVLGMDETASQGASFNVGPIDIGSQNDGESLGSTPNAVMNKDSELQTEKKSEPLQAAAENVESAVESNDSGKSSKLSPADLIASLRYYDRRRGTLPDEEPLSPEDVAVLESSRTKLTKGRKSISRSETSSDHSNRKSSFKRIGLAVSSVVVGAYIFGIGTKLLSVQPESTAAAEFLSAVQRSKVTKGPVD